MEPITVDRRISTRRHGRRGGRRATDQPASSTTTPLCPRCRQDATVLAGEAEGGWWFVCESCDCLWDQRLLANRSPEKEVTSNQAASPAEPRSWRSSAALSWLRFASGRTS